MIFIFTLTFLVLSAVGRPQNDGAIHTDLIPERREASPQNDGAIHTDLIPERRKASRQNDGAIHTDLIPERREAGPELTDEMVQLLMNGTDRQNDETDRIVGGSEVYPRYKFPYQVYMQVSLQSSF